MKTQFIPEASLDRAVCKKPGIAITFQKISPAIQKALEALREGCDEDHLIDSVDANEHALLYYHLEELKKRGFLQYKTPFVNVIPLNGEFCLQNLANLPYQLSRFTLCRLHEGKFVIENPLSSVRGQLSEEGVQLIFLLSKPTSLEELTSKFPEYSISDIKDSLTLLASAGMITSTTEECTPMAQWEFHDLYFHTRSRLGRTDANYGGTFRFRGILPSQPSIKKCTHKHLIPLDRPEKELELSFEQTMAKRRSIRQHGKQPINVRQLGEFLWRCGRIKKQHNFGEADELTSRPYPGGGARYELEIYPVVYQCDGLGGGVYHYHPLEHQLCKISDLHTDAKSLLTDARHSTGMKEYPQVLLLLSARFQRVSWKYQSMAYAVILKNVGVLIQTMYLVATASDLAPCAIGGGNSDLFCKVTQTNYLEETSVGEFMLGSLPDKSEIL